MNPGDWDASGEAGNETERARHARLREAFLGARRLDPAERAAFLERVSGGDAALVAEAEELLAAEDRESLASEDLHGALAREAAGVLGAGSPSDAPRLDDRSVLLSLDPERGVVPGVSLRDLEEEPKLPELRSGLEKYQVVGQVGEGGMGKVYLVYDQDLRRRVALKMAKEGSAAELVRFVGEAQVMGQLEHPNIVPLHDMGLTEQRRPYYTMRFMRGRSLRDVLEELRSGEPRAVRRWSLTRLVQVFLQICHAIEYAHARGVIHRDLKPANVVLGEHGEVQVIDWGLSKVLAGGSVKAEEAGRGLAGRAVGTVEYMSPEQARGEEVDARSDVYALGVLLYELLALRPPFEGWTLEVITAVLRDEPQPPRSRAPERTIPLALERACLRALLKSAGERPASVQELREEVEAWLEAEADRQKRHERAEEKVREAEAALADCGRIRAEIERLSGELDETRKRFEPWQPVEEKGELAAAEDRVEDARDGLTRHESEMVSRLQDALAFEADHPGARRLLADYYWSRFREAEAVSDRRRRDFYGTLVAMYHGGEYARELRGDGSLALDSDPPEAEAWIHDLVEEGFVLAERNGRLLGTTPLGPVILAMGSYLVILKKPGYRDVRYPVYISRNREWTGKVSLYAEDEIGEGFLYVPGGPFIQGGDPDCRVWDLPRSEPRVEDFFIARHPVTMAEYLEFLDDISLREGREAAKRRAPRPAPSAPTYLLEDNAGGLKIPEVDAEGDAWHPRWPVMGISWYDAVAYCAWRSARDGREYRLPTETEWEKASRGVDGRWFPWGRRFDPSLCNIRESRRERMTVVPVDEYPTDLSVYGVRGMAGNLRDWTASEAVAGEGTGARVARVLRGGAWYGTRTLTRCAFRSTYAPSYVFDNVGLRLSFEASRTP